MSVKHIIGRNFRTIWFELHPHQPWTAGTCGFHLRISSSSFHACLLLVASQYRLSAFPRRSEEHTSELQSLMRISYAFFCLKNKKRKQHFSPERKTMRLI